MGTKGVKNDPKWVKNDPKNDPFLIPPTFQNGEVNPPGNSQKRVKKVGTKRGQKRVKNGQKWSKMVKKGSFLEGHF